MSKSRDLLTSQQDSFWFAYFQIKIPEKVYFKRYLLVCQGVGGVLVVVLPGETNEYPEGKVCMGGLGGRGNYALHWL